MLKKKLKKHGGTLRRLEKKTPTRLEKKSGGGALGEDRKLV